MPWSAQALGMAPTVAAVGDDEAGGVCLVSRAGAADWLVEAAVALAGHLWVSVVRGGRVHER